LSLGKAAELAGLPPTEPAVLEAGGDFVFGRWGGCDGAGGARELFGLVFGLAAHAAALVTGDKDFLVLGSYEGIPILTPRKGLALLHQ